MLLALHAATAACRLSQELASETVSSWTADLKITRRRLHSPSADALTDTGQEAGTGQTLVIGLGKHELNLLRGSIGGQD